MGKGKILIVEDNIITAKHISNSLKKFGYKVTDMVNSKEAVEKSILKEKPDVAILDINLGKEVDGIQIAAELERDFGVSFIFLTSYNDDETINRILKLNPLGYIHKPFNPVDLNSMIELALYKIKSKSSIQGSPTEPENVSADVTGLDEFLFVKNGRKIERIRISKIQFIQADGRYTYIFCDGVKKISNTPLKQFRDKLANSRFVQTHKSYIVNLTKVDTITLSSLLIADFEIPVSKNYRSELLKILEIV